MSLVGDSVPTQTALATASLALAPISWEASIRKDPQFACWRAAAAALQCCMAKLLRASIVLIASCSIALEVVLLGFALASHAGFDELAIICSSDGSSGPDNGSLPERGDHCGSCLLACAAPPGFLPATNLSPMPFIERLQLFAWSFETAPARARHQPQEARGPLLR